MSNQNNQYAHLSDSELLKEYKALIKTNASIQTKANMFSEIIRRDISLDQ